MAARKLKPPKLAPAEVGAVLMGLSKSAVVDLAWDILREFQAERGYEATPRTMWNFLEPVLEKRGDRWPRSLPPAGGELSPGASSTPGAPPAGPCPHDGHVDRMGPGAVACGQCGEPMPNHPVAAVAPYPPEPARRARVPAGGFPSGGLDEDPREEAEPVRRAAPPPEARRAPAGTRGPDGGFPAGGVEDLDEGGGDGVDVEDLLA